MSGFEIPDWAMPQTADAPPPPDPAALRRQQIADNTRAEQALNGFIAGKQAALFEAPDAFYRAQGEDAIHAAPMATQKLDELRRDLLDRLGNDTQRQRLAEALDAHMHLAREGMARHVAEQSLEWQRGVAQDRIALLAKEASLHHNDDELVNSLGHAAASAARAHARVGAPSTSLRAGGSPGGESEDAAAATARSGVLGAAIQARLDRGDTAGANALFTRGQDQLDPGHAAPLQGQIDTVKRLDAAKTYADGVASMAPATSLEEIDAQHQAFAQQAEADHTDDPRQHAFAQHFLNQAFSARRQELQQRNDAPINAIQEWLNTSGADNEPQQNLPSPAVLSGLDDSALNDLVYRLNPNAERIEMRPLPYTPSLDGVPVLRNLANVPEDANAHDQESGGIAPVNHTAHDATGMAQANPQLAQAPSVEPPRRGIAPVVEPLPGNPEYEAANAQVKDARLAADDISPGEVVVLPNGAQVADGERLDDRNKRNKSPTGYMMSPVADLAPVAEAGRRTGEMYRSLLQSDDPLDAPSYLTFALFKAVGTGGDFDYQRRGPQLAGLVKDRLGVKDTFAQRPQYRNVSNFNVGLFAQQAGMSLEDTLTTAGEWAKLFGTSDPSAPYGLHRQTAKFIEDGHRAGQSGAFDSSRSPENNPR